MKIQLSKQLSTREKLLLTVLGVLIVIAAYILLVHQPVTRDTQRIQIETEEAQTALMLLQARATVLDRMQSQIEDAIDDPNAPQAADYDNLQNVMRELNAALAGAAAYDLRFDAVEPPEDGNIARRVIRMGFSCATYEQARSILIRLASGPYRSQIGNCSIDLHNRDSEREQVTVELVITYFEMLM